MHYGASFFNLLPKKLIAKKILENVSVHHHPATSTAMLKITMLVLQEKIMFKAYLWLTQGNNLQRQWEIRLELGSGKDWEIICTDWA